MKNRFEKAATSPRSEAEQVLKEWGVPYQKQPDGTLLVPGDLNISNKGLTRLPGLSCVSVTGDFSCATNQLTSLEGAPQSVTGDFSCSRNQLTSLEHAPQTVGGGFFCSNNKLTSLKYAPQSVGGYFTCSNNYLISLEGAPQKFQKLTSDFGDFSSWSEVPEEIRVSPATKARLGKEREYAFAEGATVLQAPMKARAPLKLRL